MKRFILTGLVWIICVGGVALYMNQRDTATPIDNAITLVAKAASKHTFDLEITTTFSPQPDPFALTTETTPAIEISINGTPLPLDAEAISPRHPFVLSNFGNVNIGENEIHISATPPTDAFDERHAIRLRILENTSTIAESTFWTEGGESVSGTLQFSITASASGDGNDH